MLCGHRDLRVYQQAYKLAMEIFDQSKAFPKDELYSYQPDSALVPERCSQYRRGLSETAIPEHVCQ